MNVCGAHIGYAEELQAAGTIDLSGVAADPEDLQAEEPASVHEQQRDIGRQIQFGAMYGMSTERLRDRFATHLSMRFPIDEQAFRLSPESNWNEVISEHALQRARAENGDTTDYEVTEIRIDNYAGEPNVMATVRLRVVPRPIDVTPWLRSAVFNFDYAEAEQRMARLSRQTFEAAISFDEFRESLRHLGDNFEAADFADPGHVDETVTFDSLGGIIEEEEVQDEG